MRRRAAFERGISPHGTVFGVLMSTQSLVLSLKIEDCDETYAINEPIISVLKSM